MTTNTVVSPPLVGMDAVVRDQLIAMGKIRGAATAMTTLLNLRRAVRFAEALALGEDLAVIAFRWGVKDTHIQHPFYGSAMGAFLTRAGVRVEMEALSAKDRARAVARGEAVVGDWQVDLLKGDDVWSLDAEVKRLRAAVKTTGLDVPEGTAKNAVVKGWLERANSLEELEALRTAYMTAQAAVSKAPALDKAAVAALGEITAEPSADLIAQCERVLALATA